MKRAWAVACVGFSLVFSAMTRAQVADPKAAFFQSLGRFSVALDGPLGDEGRAVRMALDGMARGLEEWDASIRASETAFATALPGSDAATAARMHVAVGAAFLDRNRVQDALREFAAGAHLDPARVDAFLFQGIAYDQALGDQEKAATSFRQATALQPGNLELQYMLARALDKTGRHAEALQGFQAVSRAWRDDVQAHPISSPAAHDAPFIRLGLLQERSGVEPFFPPVLYAEGFALLERGEFVQALEAFKQRVADDPLAANDVDPRDALGMGAAAFRGGNLGPAAQALRVAIEREPNRADAHRLLGRVLLANRADDEGVKELRLAVRLSSGDERAHLALADALVQLRRPADAEAAFRDAIKALPGSGRAHYRLGRLFQRQNRTLEALAEFETAAGLHPLIGAGRLLQVIGALNAAEQNFALALKAYSRRVDIHPNDADAHRSLAYTYLRLDRREEAFAEFAVALWLAPDAADVYVAISQLDVSNGDFDAAVEDARRAIERNPSSKQARYALASALMRLGKQDDAKPEFDAFERLQAEETAATARQMTVNGLRREAAARSDGGEYDRAVAALRKVLELSSSAASSHLELGVALLKAGQAAEALDHLQAAARLEDSLEVHEQLTSAYAALERPADRDRELARSQQLRRQMFLGEESR
jgi:tetratricopeptide (TPR) repeat protein